jgi:hypothetical protein
VSTISVGLIAACGVGQKADRWRDAWRSLRAALLRCGIGKLSNEQLIDAHSDAEKIIGGWVMRLPGAPGGPLRTSRTSGSSDRK